MKQKIWFSTMKKGVAKLNNHPNAQIGEIIKLTKEEVEWLLGSETVPSEILSSPNDTVHIFITHFLGDTILGDISTLHEVEIGMAEVDTPFGGSIKMKY